MQSRAHNYAPSNGQSAAVLPGAQWPPRGAARARSVRPPPPAAFPEKSTSHQARIVLISPDGADMAAYDFGPTIDIGRSEGDVHIVDEIFASPRHARVSLRGTSYRIHDLESVNGVYLRIPSVPKGQGADESPSGGQNPQQLRAGHILQDNDQILIGQQVLLFQEVRDVEGGVGSATQHGVLLFGSPAAPRYARLSLRSVEGITTDVFHLRKPETTLGRETGDIVFTHDPFLSRRHASIHFDLQRKFRLTDLGSANGTFVRLRGESVLRPGDQFRIGQTLFRFECNPQSSSHISHDQ